MLPSGREHEFTGKFMFPSELRANTSVPPRGEEVKVWHEIPRKDSLPEVKCSFAKANILFIFSR
jgi:hypothetical protein